MFPFFFNLGQRKDKVSPGVSIPEGRVPVNTRRHHEFNTVRRKAPGQVFPQVWLIRLCSGGVVQGRRNLAPSASPRTGNGRFVAQHKLRSHGLPESKREEWGIYQKEDSFLPSVSALSGIP